MSRLLPEWPLAGLDTTHGSARLRSVVLTPVTWIAPFPGHGAALSEVLRAAFGFGFPEPGEAFSAASARLIWSGREQALLVGAPPDPSLATHAAVIDQSDGWAAFELTGPRAEDVLARLTPLDLRPVAFAPGQTARSLLGHMNAQITSIGSGYEFLLMRSMAQTAAHELQEAMRSVAARSQGLSAEGRPSSTGVV
ncbi:sarcosine oxidase subunit gamma [Tropicimonas sp.]|uniref:sarcosine oxidase subunit gamma n=1 Tax=Tropicimonas sp. TaxID=2067044 RepID=UPI003A8BDD1D